MTTPELETPAQPLSYRVSFVRLAELRRSPVAIMAPRRPSSCPSWQVPDHQLTDPQMLVDEIADHCAEEDGYIRTEMPVQEIVFRALLTRHNEPTLLRDLHYELTERWSTPVRPITLTEYGLARI